MEAAACQSKHEPACLALGAGTRDDATWMERVAAESRGNRTDPHLTHTHRHARTPSADQEGDVSASAAVRAPVFPPCSSLMEASLTGADVGSVMLLSGFLPSGDLRPQKRVFLLLV